MWSPSGTDSEQIANGQAEAEQAPNSPALTLSEAAAACGVHRSMLRRLLDSRSFPGAFRAAGRAGPASGPWLIPVADLEQVGFSPDFSRIGPGQAAVAPEPTVNGPGTALIPLSELSGLFERLGEAQDRAAKAEAKLAFLEERLAERQAVLAELQAAQKRRGWFRRGR